MAALTLKNKLCIAKKRLSFTLKSDYLKINLSCENLKLSKVKHYSNLIKNQTSFR